MLTVIELTLSSQPQSIRNYLESHVSPSGIIAVICFLLFTGVGACAQIFKLAQRTRAWKLGELQREHICDGLHPVREMWSFSAFLLFALSGLTRSYIDYFLLLSRFPVVLMSTVILWFLQYHGARGAKKFFIATVAGDFLLFVLIAVILGGWRLNDTSIPLIIDGALSVIGVLLFYGKQLQAVKMYREQRSAAVSWLRELGLVVKDATGFWYSSSVGPELLWVSVTHVLSFISSSTICAVKYNLERKQRSPGPGRN